MSSFYHQQFVNSPVYAYDRFSAHNPSAESLMYRSLSPNSQLAYQSEQRSVGWPNQGYGNNGNIGFVQHRQMGGFPLHQPSDHDQPTFGIASQEVDNSSSHLSTDSSGHVGASRNSKYSAAASAAAAAAANSPLSHGHMQSNNSRDFTSAPSRTVYLGNVPPNIEVRQLLDHVRSGVVENVRILREKMCAFISFFDEGSALLFHSDAILKRLNIDGRDIKIGWGKPIPMDPMVAAAVSNDGATRNVYLGRLNTAEKVVSQNETSEDGALVTEEKLREDLGIFGEIESVKIIAEKGIAFVHFTSIYSAIKVVSSLTSVNPYYANKKIFYGKDRCAFITKTQQHNAAQFLGLQPGMEHLVQYTDRDFISSTLLQQSAAAAAIATAAGGANNLGNRTIYLGNLPKDVKIEEICNAVRGGLLQNIKLLSDRHVCFVTFIDPTAAAQLYAMTSLHGLTIHNKRCKIGWGKHSGALSNALALAVSHGASRNIYMGNIDFDEDRNRDSPIFTQDGLRAIFEEFGEVEQINFLPERNCCFVNFTNISNAILAIDKIKAYPHFQNLKINFGKDRCGNIPRQYR
ncbi:LADA_0D00826g1_1 [Lachancea dasiensis]|uniref:LADA_0D00826g1_1 n=1 Tax=Lachancea dasiensis TaxID=1072105 RepID=A0A1G4J3P6_9SACH|nr:LADA_0D00826g1_1 [Lachancea dasiensis]